MTIPNRLRLKEGKLILDDGGDPTQYLKAWADEIGLTEDTPICVVVRSTFEFLSMAAGTA